MKRTTVLLSVLLIATLTMAGNEMYYQKMGEALGQFSQCSSVEDFQKLANQFGVISSVESNEWLPRYYQAHCYILIGFMKNLDTESRDAYLDKAATQVEALLKAYPEEAEILTLQAFCLTAQMLINPAQRSMSTAPMIYSSLGKALALEPNNPRAKFLRISNEMGTASFFGEDTGKYCTQAAELLESWDAYELKSPIHPSWGKGETTAIVRQCGMYSDE